MSSRPKARLQSYYRAEHRGFEPGMEPEDGLAAEAEINAWLRSTKIAL